MCAKPAARHSDDALAIQQRQSNREGKNAIAVLGKLLFVNNVTKISRSKHG